MRNGRRDVASRPTEIGHIAPVGQARALPVALTRARAVVTELLRPILDELDLTEQQLRVLRTLIGVDSLEVHEIAEHTLLLPPSVSRILQALEKRGLIVRSVTEYDHRISRISLSEEGQRLAAENIPVWAERFQAVVGHYGKKRYEHLVDELLDFAAIDVDAICNGGEAAAA